jgi:protein ImuB
VEAAVPGVEVVRPGLIALLAQGPVRYYGGTRPAAVRLIDQVGARTGVECQIGIADGLFAATLAAHRGVVVERGRTREFLAPLLVEELEREPGVDRAELISLLRRLGLRSLGAFAALPVADVASRFGSDAVLAHRLARGLDPRPPARRRPPGELAVSTELDPPVTRVDAAAFASRALAERLHALLAGHGLACTRLSIRARTVDGAELARVWRCAEPLTPSGTMDRVRWQLDAWLTRELAGRERNTGAAGNGVHEPAGTEYGGIRSLRLSGEEVVPAGALQLGLWGDVGAGDERAGRALVRVQALLGPEGVYTAVLGGGRGTAERVRLVPWGDDRGVRTESSASGTRINTESSASGTRIDTESSASGTRINTETEPVAPWPGRLPAPSPTTVPERPLSAEVLAEDGRPIRVTDRYALTASPVQVALNGGRPMPLRAWAGPWPVDQRWWDGATGWRGSRLQVVVAGTDAGGAPLGAGAQRDPHRHRGDPVNSAGPAPPAGEARTVSDEEVNVTRDGDELEETALLLLCGEDGRWTVTGVYD